MARPCLTLLLPITVAWYMIWVNQAAADSAIVLEYQVLTPGQPVTSESHYITQTHSRIDRLDETVILDYHERRVHRLNPRTGAHRQFEFDIHDESSAIDPIGISMRRRLGELKVEVSSETADVNGLPGHICLVQFGAGMMFSKMMSPPRSEAFGQTFTEASSRIVAGVQFEHVELLQQFAEKRKPALAALPLLKQIDPLGLFDDCEGLPLNIELYQGQTKQTRTLRSIRLAEVPDIWKVKRLD